MINFLKSKVSTIGILILIVLIICGVSWIVTCGVIKLITLCFGWKFSWGIATGIWLILGLLSSALGNKITYRN